MNQRVLMTSLVVMIFGMMALVAPVAAIFDASPMKNDAGGDDIAQAMGIAMSDSEARAAIIAVHQDLASQVFTWSGVLYNGNVELGWGGWDYNCQPNTICILDGIYYYAVIEVDVEAGVVVSVNENPVAVPY